MSLVFKEFGAGGVRIVTEWHVGEPLPALEARVIHLFADGHELDFLIDAMKSEIDAMKKTAAPPVGPAAVIDFPEPGK